MRSPCARIILSGNVFAIIGILFLSISCGVAPHSRSNLSSVVNNWKGVFLAGYYMNQEANGLVPADAWDNATRDLKSKIVSDFGQSSENFRTFTKNSSLNLDGDASLENMDRAFDSLNLSGNDGCFVFMTSHGSPGGSFGIEQSNGIMPTQLFDMLARKCGERPTAVIVSACYSGAFVTHAKSQARSNLVVLTAAADVPSFGCDSSREYTFYDQCVIETLDSSNAKSLTWTTLSSEINKCVTAAESGMTEASNPQNYIGADLADEIIFSSSNSSNTDGLKENAVNVNLAGPNNNITLEVSTPMEYDRVVICYSHSVEQCPNPIALDFTRVGSADRIIFESRTPLDLSEAGVGSSIFIFSYKKGNLGSQADNLRTVPVRSTM